MGSYTFRTIEKWLLSLVMICLMIALSVIDVHAADYTDPVDVKFQYTQTYDADADRKNDTFTYKITPLAGAPAPQGSSNGVYYFSVQGVPGKKPVNGTVNLRMVFPKPGEYKYQVSAYVSNPKKGFTYDKHTYNLHVYVKNAADGGLKADTVSGESGYKNGVLKFTPAHESEVVPEEQARPITTPRGDGNTAVRTADPGQPAPAVEPEEEPEPETPAQQIIEKVAPKPDPERDYWALINLLEAIATALIAVVMLVRYFGRIDTDEDDYIIRREGKLRLLGLIPAVVSVITFILTEDLSLPMELTDEWTMFMTVVLLLGLATALIAYFKYDRDSDEESSQGNPA